MHRGTIKLIPQQLKIFMALRDFLFLMESVLFHQSLFDFRESDIDLLTAGEIFTSLGRPLLASLWTEPEPADLVFGFSTRF